MKVILDLCGGSGSWGYFYSENGYKVINVTLPEFDVRNYTPPPNVYGILAAPPCTEFSIVRNHNIKNDLDSALSIVHSCLEIIRIAKPKFWALENPIGYLSKYIGKPQYSFQPWWFGDPWTKHTHIWGDFNIPKRMYTNWEDVQKINGLYVRPGRKKPSMACQHLSHKNIINQLTIFNCDNDASFRAITPPGFAKAFFDINN